MDQSLKDITASASIIQKHLSSTGEHAFDATFDFSIAAKEAATDEGMQQVETARQELLRACKSLQTQLRAPAEAIKEIGASVTDAMALHTIYRFDVARNVPMDGEISLQDLAIKCKLNQTDLTRILRYATTSRIFAEPRVGYISHTPISKALVTDELLKDNVGIMTDEMFPAAAMMTWALIRDPYSQNPTSSGWNLANGATIPYFQELAAKHSSRLSVVKRGMSTAASITNAKAFVDDYDWSQLPADAVVVDVGGGLGNVSMAIARKTPSVSCIVQDMPAICREGEASLPEELKDRIKFVTHDIFEVQTVHDADMYLLRAVFRNWPDSHCVKVLKALIPALKSGARVVVNDPILPTPGAPIPVEQLRAIWGFDLSMMTFFHGRDREASEWRDLFARADSRFKFGEVIRPSTNIPKGIPPGALLGYAQAIWDP